MIRALDYPCYYILFYGRVIVKQHAFVLFVFAVDQSVVILQLPLSD